MCSVNRFSTWFCSLLFDALHILRYNNVIDSVAISHITGYNEKCKRRNLLFFFRRNQFTYRTQYTHTRIQIYTCGSDGVGLVTNRQAANKNWHANNSFGWHTTEKLKKRMDKLSCVARTLWDVFTEIIWLRIALKRSDQYSVVCAFYTGNCHCKSIASHSTIHIKMSHIWP